MVGMINRKKLVADIQAVLEDKHPMTVLDRVIGYGSYFWGDYIEGQSDIDVAVVVTSGGLAYGNVVKPVTWAIDVSLAVIDGVNFHVMTAESLEADRALTHTMRGKVLARGDVLYANPRTRSLRTRLQKAASKVPYVDVRARYVLMWTKHAQRFVNTLNNAYSEEAMAGASDLLVDVYRRCVVPEAQAATVFSLWSVLYENEIDASPKAIRWNAGRLATIASMFRPELAELIPSMSTFPNEHLLNSTFRFGDDEIRAAMDTANAVVNAVNKNAAIRKESA
jgi:predicted nucleotidyltransferase